MVSQHHYEVPVRSDRASVIRQFFDDVRQNAPGTTEVTAQLSQEKRTAHPGKDYAYDYDVVVMDVDVPEDNEAFASFASNLSVAEYNDLI